MTSHAILPINGVFDRATDTLVGLLVPGGIIIPISGTGSVTSVTLTSGSNKLTVGGSPVTTAGTLTVDIVESNLNLANIGGNLASAKVVYPSGTISSNHTVANVESSGSYRISASCTITVPLVGQQDGNSQTFLANFNCEYFLDAGITVTFQQGTTAVIFNGSGTVAVPRAQSGTTNSIVAIASNPVISNNYIITGV